ncbi:hypothetical protein D6745_00425, partial [Candidatus Woesearchaeota archaeon]
MEEALIYLTYIVVILLLGLICTLITNRLRIPNVLFLILIGVFLNSVRVDGKPVIDFSPVFIVAISIIALVLIVFDSSSRLKLKQFDTFSSKALKMTIIALVLNVSVLGSAAFLLFGIKSVPFVIILGIILSGTGPDVVMTILKQKSLKTVEFLKIESILNTPLTVLLPFIILDLVGAFKGAVFPKIFEHFVPFLQQIVAGIGAGIVIGIIVFKVMRKSYSETLSPLAIITAALLSYILAENLGGNGVLAVTTLGLFFGNVYIKEKGTMQEFSSMFANSLEILVFILVGLIISIPMNPGFLGRCFLLYIVYLALRYVSLRITFLKSNFTDKELLYMTLVSPKGIATAAITFSLLSLNSKITGMLNVILVTMIYTIIISTFIVKAQNFFMHPADKEHVN